MLMKKMVFIMAMAISLVTAFTGLAQAQGWHEHGRYVREWHGPHVRYVWRGPYLVAAPPVVYVPTVYPAPYYYPVVVSPPPGINIVIPIR